MVERRASRGSTGFGGFGILGPGAAPRHARRDHMHLGLLAVVLLVLLVPAAAAQTQLGGQSWGFHSVTNDVRRAHYVDGHLSWGDSGGHVSWDEVPANHETPIPGQPLAEAAAYAGWTLHTNTGGSVGTDLIPALVFQSDPFPKDVYVDAQRVVHVNLLAKLSSCNYALEFSLEARIDGKIWGGMPVGLSQEVDLQETDPTPRQGWCLVPFRFHSEIDRIEKGSVVTLTVFYHHTNARHADTPPHVGFGPDAPTSIHIPYYPPEEVVLRRPEFQGSSATVPVAMGIGGALLLAVPADRRRGLACLLLVAPLLAGCASSGTPSDPDAPAGGLQEYRIDPRQPSDPTNASEPGMIVGVVHDVLSAPVAGAHVALLGTDLSTKTSSRGNFVFDGLDNGTYRYRIDHQEHLSFEASVEVRVGSITRVDILLQYRDNRTGDELPHRHTLWAGADSKVIFDEVLGEDFVCTNSLGATGLWQDTHCTIPFLLPLTQAGQTPLMVYPGTQRMELTATWGGGTVQNVGFYVTPNIEAAPGNFNPNSSIMWPRPSGQTTHVHVPWEWADVGHQQWSAWALGVWIPLDAGVQSNGLRDVRAVTIEGPLHVKVEIFKGIIPLEPGHPDRWGDADSLVVIDGASSSFFVRPTEFVPTGTKWLQITFERDRQTIGDKERLYYTAADSPLNGPASISREIVFPQDALKQSVNWPVWPEEADPPYAKQSNWQFTYSAEGDNTVPGNLVRQMDENVQGQVVFRLTVVAHRTAVPSDAAVRDA